MRERVWGSRTSPATKSSDKGVDQPNPNALLALQRRVGNSAAVHIMRLLDSSREAGREEASSVRRALGHTGTPIEEQSRAKMESQFGTDFRDVRLHVDRASTELLSAKAYTVGKDIVFHPEQSDHSGSDGQKTLAHELTHVVQQRRGPVDGSAVGTDLKVSDPEDRFEKEAERTADAVTAATVSSPQGASPIGTAPRHTVARSVQQALMVQREGGTSVRDRIKFFQEGKSSLETEKKAAKEKGPIASFQDALQMFQQLEGTEAKKSAPESHPPSTVPVPEEQSSIPSPSNPATELLETKEEGGGIRAPEGAESLGGKSFGGKRLDSHYKTTEKINYDPSTGMAKATWSGSEGRSVKYLSDEQRKDYELKLQKGTNLFFWRGEALDTSQMNRATTFEGRAGDGKVIFVMAVDGSIYLANELQEARLGNQENDGKKWRFNHSSFIRGKKVAGAGELWFAGGKLKGISDNSGHYKPGLNEILQVLRRFQQAGVDLSTIAVDRRVGDGATKGEAKTEVLDGQTLLELGSSKLVQDDLGTLERKSSRVNQLSGAARLLSQANERQAGVDLAPAIARVLGLAKLTAQELKDELGRDRPSRKEAASLANDLWDAYSAIDAIDARWISSDGFNAADDLAEELKAMQDVDHDDRDYSSARTNLTTVIQQLSSTSAPVVVGKSAALVGEETKDKARSLEGIGYLVDEASQLIERMRTDGGFHDLTRFFESNRARFLPIIRSATVRKDVSLDWVIAKTKELAAGSDSSAAGLRILEALRPGAGKELMNDGLKGEIGKAATKFESFFESFLDDGDIRDVAFDFARKLVGESGAESHARQIALQEVLKKRAETGAEVSTVDSFISRILLPGGKANEEDNPEDAVRIYLAANSLVPNTVDQDDITDLEERI